MGNVFCSKNQKSTIRTQQAPEGKQRMKGGISEERRVKYITVTGGGPPFFRFPLTKIQVMQECVLWELMPCEVSSAVCKHDPPLYPSAPSSLPKPTPLPHYQHETASPEKRGQRFFFSFVHLIHQRIEHFIDLNLTQMWALPHSHDLMGQIPSRPLPLNSREAPQRPSRFHRSLLTKGCYNQYFPYDLNKGGIKLYVYV